MSKNYIGNKWIKNLIGPNKKDVDHVFLFTSIKPIYKKYLTITWKYLNTSNEWVTETETVLRGTLPTAKTISNNITVSAGVERKVFTQWDSLAKITYDRTITAQYKTQYYAVIAGNNCDANLISNWYDSGTSITWTPQAHFTLSDNSAIIDHGGNYSKTATGKTYNVSLTYVPVENSNIVSSSMKLSTLSKTDAYTGGTNPKSIQYAKNKYVYFCIFTTPDYPAPDGYYWASNINEGGTGYSNDKIYGEVYLTEDTFTFDETNLTANGTITTDIRYTLNEKQMTTITGTAGAGILSLKIRGRDAGIPGDRSGHYLDVDGDHELPYEFRADNGAGTVYGYVTIDEDYLPADNWELVNGKTNVYYVGQWSFPGYTVGGTVDIGTFNAIEKTKYNISFTGTDCTWADSILVAYDGDSIKMNNNTATCYKRGNTSLVRWTNTATANPNTAQYTYSRPGILTQDVDNVTSAVNIDAASGYTVKNYKVTNTDNRFKVRFAPAGTPNSGVNSTSLSNIDYGTTIRYAIGAEDGYYIPDNSSNGGHRPSSTVVYGDVELTTDCFDFEVNAIIKTSVLSSITEINPSTLVSFTDNYNTYTINTSGTGISAAYLYNYGTNESTCRTNSGITSKDIMVEAVRLSPELASIYGFVVIEQDFEPDPNWYYYYGVNSDNKRVYRVFWIHESDHINGEYPYRYYPGGKTFTFGPYNAIEKTKYTISFSSTYCNWQHSSLQAGYNDYISISGNTVTCSYWQGGPTRWTNTVSKRSDTSTYTYGSPSISTSSFTVQGAATISASASRTANDVIVFKFNPEYGHTSVWKNANGNTITEPVPYITGTSLSITQSDSTVHLNGPTSNVYTPYPATGYLLGKVTSTKTGTLSGGVVTVTVGVTKASDLGQL